MKARRFDVAVIGAGPAGALAARQLALAGHSTLLVDKARFPRNKPCGCCLNAEALACLRRAGLGHVPTRCGAQRIAGMRLCARGRRVSLPLPGGVSVSRAALDAALADAAAEAGAEWQDGTNARLVRLNDPAHTLELQRDGRTQRVESRVLVVADGVGGRLLRDVPGFACRTGRRSHVGVAAVLEHRPKPDDDSIVMCCGHGGYVGVAPLESGRSVVAAALAPALIRHADGAASACEALMRRCELRCDADLHDASWRGTGPLTCRRQRVAGQRLFVIGDSAGFVEPFTGQGIAWAMASALAVVEPVLAALRNVHGHGVHWQRQWRMLTARPHRRCRAITGLLRSPALVGLSVNALRYIPTLGRPLIHHMYTAQSPAEATI